MTLKNLVPSFGKKKVPVRYEDDPFKLFHGEMERLVDNFFNGFEIEPFGGRLGTFSPGFEVAESDKEIKISAELPGMDEKDIDISLANDSLTISGEKKAEKESEGKDYHIKERSYGSFSRMISLYAAIDSDKVEAHFKKGVLIIILPKSEKERERKKKIAVKVE